MSSVETKQEPEPEPEQEQPEPVEQQQQQTETEELELEDTTTTVMSSELSSGSNPTSPTLGSKTKGVDGPAPKAQPEDTSDVAFPEDGMPLNPGEQTVQFIPGQDPSNGDAKVEIGETHGQPKFVGLGKEELMKFANDPFWVRLRWILFILFWLIWLAMLVGAVVIILYAPKCADKLIGPTEGPYYQLDLKSFSSNGKLDGVSDARIEYLRALGVKSVIISQVLATDPSEEPERVIDFKSVSTKYGGVEQLKGLVKRFREKAIKVLLQFIPNHSSIKHEWFTNLTTRENYYVLKSVDEASTWKVQPGSAGSASAWTAAPDDDKNRTYLHQFSADTADLNLKSKEVVGALNEALQFWFEDMGVDGFLFSKVSYLRESLDRLNDQNAMINQAANDGVVRNLVDATKWNTTYTDAKGAEAKREPFALVELDSIKPEKTASFYSPQAAVISNSLSKLNESFSGDDLRKAIEETISAVPRNPVHWRLATRSRAYSQDKSNALTLVAAFLRGQLIIEAGDEYGATGAAGFSQPGGTDRNLQFHSTLFGAVEALNQTGAGGGTTQYETNEKRPQEFVMLRSNDKDFVVVANFGTPEAEISIENFKGDRAAIAIASTPNSNIGNNVTYDAILKELKLPGESAVALQLVPKE